MVWTSHDINELHSLLQQNFEIATIAEMMKRSKKSVAKAAKQVLIQQLLYHDPSEVAANYNMTIDDLRSKIVDKRFYMPVKAQMVPSSIYMLLLVLFTAGISRFGMVLSHNWNN